MSDRHHQSRVTMYPRYVPAQPCQKQCPVCKGVGFFDAFGRPSKQKCVNGKPCNGCTGTRIVQYHMNVCFACHGHGQFDAFDNPDRSKSICTKTCTTCHGNGLIATGVQIPMTHQKMCPICNGVGFFDAFGHPTKQLHVNGKPCNGCAGTRMVQYHTNMCFTCHGHGQFDAFDNPDRSKCSITKTCTTCCGNGLIPVAVPPPSYQDSPYQDAETRRILNTLFTAKEQDEIRQSTRELTNAMQTSRSHW